MKSINFPNMFHGLTTNVISDNDATLNNLKLLLYSDKYSLLGDPYYGTNLKRMIFDQNNTILQDLVIDDIFDAIVNFMPQVRLSRNDIKVYSKKRDIYCSVKLTNILDYSTNLYEINLTKTEG